MGKQEIAEGAARPAGRRPPAARRGVAEQGVAERAARPTGGGPAVGAGNMGGEESSLRLARPIPPLAVQGRDDPTAADEATAERPFPPGDYPLLVVGSGPGGLQLSYWLDRLGIDHAVLSADDGPGGMFRRWPLFQRLLSWTKPYALPDRAARAFERYDWNSLLAEEPELRGLAATVMDGTSSFPSRPEMAASLVAFAERARIRVRYGCRWTATRQEEDRGGRRFVLVTSDGEYRAPIVVFAVGVAEPFRPPIPGIELAHHYADVRPPETYAGRRVLIVGKRNSAFELANGLLPWAASLLLVSPSPAKLSVVTRSLVGVRARYVQPYEDFALGGGVGLLDAAIERIERLDGALAARLRPSDGGEAMTVVADEIIEATGFAAPVGDLPDLGLAVVGQGRIPAQTAWWESASLPGVYFAGTLTQGSGGLKKHGQPSNSGAVHGFRYNARILARRLAATAFGRPLESSPIHPAELIDFLLDEATLGPELWHQKAYLARVIGLDPSLGARDEGIVPLTAFLDGEVPESPTAVAMTVEADAAGEIYPVAYVRSEGRVGEHALPGHRLHEFRTPEHRRALAAAIGPLGAGLVAAD